jgi:hypothetical protein
MLRSIHYESGDDTDEDDDGDGTVDNADAENENQGPGGEAAMEEDSLHGDEEQSMTDQDTENSAEGSTFFPVGSEAMALTHSSDMIVRPQMRTVSITNEDL